MSIDKWTLESALDAAVDCLNRHLPGYIQARLDADAERDRPLINGKLPVPKVVTTGMLDDLAADWITPAIFVNATSTSYQNYNASSLLDSQPRVTATILMAEGDIDTSEQRVYSNALSMYSDGVRYILSTIFPEDGGCEVGVQAATPDSVQYSPLVRPDGYPVWLRWSEVSIVWTQRVVNSWSTDPPPFDPLSLGPWAYWDASDASTLFVDSSGTIPAVVGDPIGCIKDKSGNGWNATQTVSASRPIYEAQGLLYSESNSHFLQVTATIGYPRTIFAWTGQRGGLIGWLATTAQFSITSNTGGDNSLAIVRSAAGNVPSGYVPWGTSKHVIAEDSGTAVTIYSDAGTATAPLPAGASVTPAAGNPFVLFRSTRFQRVMVFNRILTPAERAKLLAWAATQV